VLTRQDLASINTNEQTAMTNIRELRPEDLPAWIELWQGYLHFYRAEIPARATDLAFARLTEQRDGYFGLVAEGDDGRLAGFAHCLLQPSTWSLGGSCYLEDLFVDPSHRGTGTGRSLIDAASEQSRAAGAETMYWHTQAFNAPARSLYDTLAQLTSYVHYERDLK
jgi:GNAT superfamily N-acetyltransferase